MNENLRRKSHSRFQADNNAQGKRDTRSSVGPGSGDYRQRGSRAQLRKGEVGAGRIGKDSMVRRGLGLSLGV